MLVTVFGAAGKVGSRIVRTALSLGHEVRAFGRSIENMIDEDLRNDRLTAIKGYVFEEAEVYLAVKGADAVLTALNGATDGTDKTLSLGTKNIVSQMRKAGVERIVVVGDAAILKDDKYEYAFNEPNYPADLKPVALEYLKAYEHLQESALEWTFICCPDIIELDANGKFVTSEDYAPHPNLFHIRTGNLALFMIEEMKQNRYLKKRVGISDKN
jgi:putative NADH-flavin reductase